MKKHIVAIIRSLHRLHILAAIIIVICGSITYANSFNTPFVFDDIPDIVKNTSLRDMGNFWPPSLDTRWFGWLTFALNYAVGGLDVTGYHLANILIHLLSGFLLYTMVLTTFSSPQFIHSGENASPKYAREFVGLFSALIFIVHPVQTQAVTYIVQRFASLATMLYLLTIVLYAKSRLSNRRLHSILWYAGALFAAILAMKTKEIAFTIPVIVAIYEFVFFQAALKRRIALLLPILATTLVIPFSILLSQKGSQDTLTTVDAATRLGIGLSRHDYLATQTRVIATYLRLLLLPVNQNIDYDYPVYHAWLSRDIILSSVLHAVLWGAGVALLVRTRNRASENAVASHANPLLALIGFGIVWFYITLSVESSIIPIKDVIFEHRLYLPSVGIILAAVSACELLRERLFEINERYAKIVVYVVSIATVLYAAAAVMRNYVWSDNLHLWTDAAMKSPGKDRPHEQLGDALLERGRFDEAAEEIRKALAVNPTLPHAHYNLANCYMEQGRMDEAAGEYEAAIRFDPNNHLFSLAYYNLGKIYASRGRLQDAAFKFITVLTLNPYSANAHNELGDVYRKQGNLEAARKEFETALRFAPDFEEARKNLSAVTGR